MNTDDKIAKCTSTDELQQFETKSLLAFYNANVDNPINRFRDRSNAVARTLKLIKSLNRNSQEDTEMTTKKTSGKKTSTRKKASSKKASSKKKAAVKREGAGRVSQHAGKFIYKLVDENPRREGTWGYQSFGFIENGMTYESFIEAGGRPQDLNWDIAHGNVEVRAKKK